MARSGGRDQRAVEIAMILADGWIRLSDTHAAEDVGVALRESSICLAINSDRMDVSKPELNGPTCPSIRGGLDVHRSSSEGS